MEAVFLRALPYCRFLPSHARAVKTGAVDLSLLSEFAAALQTAAASIKRWVFWSASFDCLCMDILPLGVNGVAETLTGMCMIYFALEQTYVCQAVMNRMGCIL